MIETVKKIVKNYMENAKLTTYMVGTVQESTIKVSDKMSIPMTMIAGNLKSTLVSGDQVRLLRKAGGHEYFILEVVQNGEA